MIATNLKRHAFRQRSDVGAIHLDEVQTARPVVCEERRFYLRAARRIDSVAQGAAHATNLRKTHCRG